ncbi:MAG: (d)CMP kinase [Gemmatimonadaceae bacterium]
MPRPRRPGTPIIVAVDGPAASGKSSTAQWVAQQLGFRHVDSGALYRAATALALQMLPDPGSWTEGEILDAVRGVVLRETDASMVPASAAGELGELVRSPTVTQHVSRVAQMPRVREWVNELVRAAARKYSVIVDGRDIGTVVFPEADLKVFLVADPWERARRRLLQRLSRTPSDAEIAAETERLVQRDARDATQTVQARDAVLIDTTYLAQEEQVERIVALVRVLVGREG